MPSVVKTFAFASDAEGLTDAGNAANLAFAHVAGDGNPSGCVAFTTANKSVTLTELARRAATGETWESWGVPSGATVTQVQITAWGERCVGNTKLSSHAFKARVIGSGGASVHAAGDLLDVALGTTTDATWQSGAAGTARAVDVGAQASTTDVRLELEYTCTTSGGGGSAAVDQRFDQIALTITHSAAGFTLAAGSGSVALTGQSAGLLAARRSAAVSGSFALTGQDAALTQSSGATHYTLTAESGGVVVSGQAAGLSADRRIAVSVGAHAASGFDAGLSATRKLTAAPATLSTSGSDVGLRRDARLSASAGPYALTGAAAGVAAARALTASPGAYALDGQTAGLNYSGGVTHYSLTATTGSISASGQVAALRTARRATASPGALAATGQDVALRSARRCVSAAGAFAMSGSDVALSRGYQLAADPGVYELAGQMIVLGRTYALGAEVGSFVLTGSAVTLARSESAPVAPTPQPPPGMASGLPLFGSSPTLLPLSSSTATVTPID